jgi:hypothetical protein
MQIRCHRHIARIKQAVDIAPQQQSVPRFVRTALSVGPYVRRL